MKPSQTETLRFPARIAILLAAASLLFVAWVAWSSYTGYRSLQRSSAWLLELERQRGRIVHIDEVLTMSARMAAASGATRWIDRYYRFEPQLTQALEAAIALADGVADSREIVQAVTDTSDANTALVTMEEQAFALVRENRSNDARSLLGSNRYEQLKVRYADGMQRLLTQIEAALDAGVNQRRARLGAALALSLLFAFIVLVLLRLTLRKLADWRAMIEHSNSQLAHSRAETQRLNRDLERRVSARTQALRESQAQLESVLSSAPIVLYALDENGVFTLCESAPLTSTGIERNELLGRNAFNYEHGDEQMFAPLRRAYAGESVRTQVKLGDTVFDSSYTPVFDERGHVVSVIGVATDITERDQAQTELRALSQAVSQHPAGIALVDLDGIIRYVNPRFSEIMQGGDTDLVGLNWHELRAENTSRRQTNRLRNLVTAGRQWQGEFRHRRADGENLWIRSTLAPIRNAEGKLFRYLYMVEDISDQKRTRNRLDRQTNFDNVSGLPNRKMSLERLHTALQEGGELALIIVDIDNFKHVNDSLGHDVGDQLIALVAKRLLDWVDPADTVARLGGDEFLLLIRKCPADAELKQRVQALIDSIGEQYELEQRALTVTASAGVARAPQDGKTTQTLLRHCDAAMYQAKEAGRNTYRFFSRDIESQKQERLALERALHGAIDAGELELYYQPIIDLRSGKATHAEALLRWHSREFGPVPPDRFIPIAEESDLILEIGDWVLRQACLQSRAWRESETGPISIAVNLSPRQFLDDGFSEEVLRILDETGALPADIELEITERLLIADPPTVARKLSRLSEHGLKICIDDFGTGYSSLSYLKHYPVDTLKIDRIFVRDVVDDPADAELAAGIINIGHSLSLKLTGEGVETQEQLEFLRARGCDLAQGYYFSRPLPAAEFTAWVVAQPQSPASE